MVTERTKQRCTAIVGVLEGLINGVNSIPSADSRGTLLGHSSTCTACLYERLCAFSLNMYMERLLCAKHGS